MSHGHVENDRRSTEMNIKIALESTFCKKASFGRHNLSGIETISRKIRSAYAQCILCFLDRQGLPPGPTREPEFSG